MPQFCNHCGAIETPTWRKLYVKECLGKPSRLDSVEGEGETIGIETTETDEVTGDATKFIIRKSMKKTKDNLPGPGFEGVTLCNPCGLWFNKFRHMRPQEKWGRKSSTRKRKSQKPEEAGTMTDGLEPQSEAFFTDQVAPEDMAGDEGDGSLDDATVDAMPPPTGRPRANSMQAQQQRRGSSQEDWNASQLDAALARAVQSSPGFRGSQQSPIEIKDLTPRPTRRLLFPSPRKDGEVKSLDDNGQVSLKSNLSASDMGSKEKPSVSPKPGLEMAFEHTETNIFEAFTFDKENVSPQLDIEDDDLARLFEGSPNMVFKTPRKTPVKNMTTPRSMRQLNHLLKTPSPRSRTRKPLTPSANAANNATLNNTANINDFLTSPSSSRYFLRSTPSRLERTPGRRSDSEQQELSPWSRQLAQMLSDGNDTAGTFTSPSRQFDFSDLPTFTTPGRLGLEGCDWEGIEGMLSSEFAAYDGSGGMEQDGGGGGR